MKREDLFRSLPIPEPDAAARSRALSRALVALRNREGSVARRERRVAWPWPAVCGMALLLACLAVLPTRFKGPDRTRADLRVLHEMASLFENRLVAVVEQGEDVDVQLSTGEIPASEQPVRILLRRGRKVVRVLSFSGRELCLELDGRKTCLAVLATGEGGVTLVGGDFLWSPQNPARLAGYRVEASTIPPAS